VFMHNMYVMHACLLAGVICVPFIPYMVNVSCLPFIACSSCLPYIVMFSQ
jgi:hypothetical protein